MTKLIKGNILEHLWEESAPLVTDWLWLVPEWIESIIIHFDNGDPGTLSNRIEEEYRVMYLYIHPGWMKIPTNDRSKWILHELCHIFLDHLDKQFHALEDSTLKPEDALFHWAEGERRRALERGTTDLENVLWKRYSDGRL